MQKIPLLITQPGNARDDRNVFTCFHATFNLMKRSNIMKYRHLIAVLILAGLSSVATAQMQNQNGGNNGQGGPGMGQGGGERPHGPPPQAIAACNGKASGASCTFQGRENKTLTGTCFAPPGDNHPLACRPEHGGQNRGGQQPNGQAGNQPGKQGGNQ
jgi:hypothetical protein